jgi:hypothetical protein
MITYQNAKENGYFINIRTRYREENVNGLYSPQAGWALWEDGTEEEIGSKDTINFKKAQALFLIEHKDVEYLTWRLESLEYLIQELTEMTKEPNPIFTKRDILIYRWELREIFKKLERLEKEKAEHNAQ